MFYTSKFIFERRFSCLYSTVSQLIQNSSQSRTSSYYFNRKLLSTVQNNSSTSLFTRFRSTYKYYAKEYGKTLIVVHTLNCVCWFTGFYLVAGHINVTRLMELLGVSKETAQKYEPKRVVAKMYDYWDVPAALKWMGLEKAANKAKPENLGDIAVALVLYKLFALPRYMVSIGATVYMARLLTRLGYIRSLPPTETFKKFVTEGRKEMADNRRSIVRRKNRLFRSFAKRRKKMFRKPTRRK